MSTDGVKFPRKNTGPYDYQKANETQGKQKIGSGTRHVLVKTAEGKNGSRMKRMAKNAALFPKRLLSRMMKTISTATSRAGLNTSTQALRQEVEKMPSTPESRALLQYLDALHSELPTMNKAQLRQAKEAIKALISVLPDPKAPKPQESKVTTKPTPPFQRTMEEVQQELAQISKTYTYALDAQKTSNKQDPLTPAQKELEKLISKGTSSLGDGWDPRVADYEQRIKEIKDLAKIAFPEPQKKPPSMPVVDKNKPLPELPKDSKLDLSQPMPRSTADINEVRRFWAAKLDLVLAENRTEDQSALFNELKSLRQREADATPEQKGRGTWIVDRQAKKNELNDLGKKADLPNVAKQPAQPDATSKAPEPQRLASQKDQKPVVNQTLPADPKSQQQVLAREFMERKKKP